MPEPSPQSTPEEKRRNFDAYLKARAQGPDAGLAELGDRTDPDAVAIRLSLLASAKRFAHGADLVRGLPPHERWCRMAVHAFVQTGEAARAHGLVDWARGALEVPARWQACCAAFAESALLFLQMPPPTREKVVLQPGSLDEAQEALLSEAIEVLEPAVQTILPRGKLANTLETALADAAFRCHFLLRHRSECQRYYRLLETGRPVPLLLAQFALVDWLDVDPPDDLPARLRADHPDLREAKMRAAFIEAATPGKQNEAFEALLPLLDENPTSQERQEIGEWLVELKAKLDPARRERCEQLLSKLIVAVGSDRFALLTEAENALRDGKAVEAAAILDRRRDEADVHWLQLRAGCHLALGEKGPGGELLRQACRIFPTPTLLRRAADAVAASGDLDAAREVLERLVGFEPDDVRALKNLAALALESNQMSKAAGYYARLQKLEPGEPRHLLNEAGALVSAGELEAGRKRFDALCANPGRLEREAILGRAQLLKAQDQAEEAFQSLEGVRGKFWEDLQFVGVYLGLAFASGHDARGHEALERTLELQQEDGAPRVMEAVSLGALQERLQDHGKDILEAHEGVLQGKLPWLLADSVARTVPYAAMAIRTQPLRWTEDAPLAREQYSVYATDAFVYRLQHLTDGKNPLAYEIMRCAPAGGGIVVDQTALITLHRLGLLDRCADYFGKVLFPVGYLAQLLEDSDALVFHQPSWMASLEAIRRAIDLQKIGVVDDAAGMARIDEYDHPEDDPGSVLPYRLRDVLDLLAEDGKISDEEETESRKLFHEPARAQPGEADALRASQTVLFTLATLRSLANAGHLDAALGSLNVRLSRADYGLLNMETRSADHQKQTYQEHTALWRKIQGNARFEETGFQTPEEFRGEGMAREKVRHLSSTWVAGEGSTPLMVDDRVLQRLAIHGGAAAFGTDRFLLALGQAEILPWREVAEAFMTMVCWRYRFLIPCPEILLALAKSHRKHPPGRPLRELAFYVQDCMRDAGLPVGYADHTPGSSVAHALFYRLTAMAGEFAVDVWADGNFEPDAANALTHWIGRSLLPAGPTHLRDGRTTILVAQSARIMLSAAFVRAAKIPDTALANRALRAVATALALDDREYEQILTGVLHGK